MKHALELSFALGIAALAVTFVTLTRAGEKHAAQKFRKPPINALGVTGLDDLRGKPVLVDFWGTHCPPCIGYAVPSALKLQDEYGDALQVVLVECQGTPRDQFEAFAWRRKWMGTAALWTEEQPVPMNGNMLPESALIGVDGHVVIQGNPVTLGNKLEEALAAEVQKSKEPPADAPAALRPAWSAFLGDDVTAALAACDRVGTNEAEATRELFIARTKQRIARAQRMFDEGRVLAAQTLAARLAKAVKGSGELETLALEAVQRGGAPELALERDGDKEVSAFFAEIAKREPFDDANVRRAETLAAKYSGTKSGARAAHFAELARTKMPD